jgi:hypothetical protein
MMMMMMMSAKMKGEPRGVKGGGRGDALTEGIRTVCMVSLFFGGGGFLFREDQRKSEEFRSCRDTTAGPWCFDEDSANRAHSTVFLLRLAQWCVC